MQNISKVNHKSAKALIFDIDGSLVDSVDLHAESWREAFNGIGKRIPFIDLRPHIGKGSDMLIPSFLDEKETKRFAKQLSQDQEEIFKKRYFRLARPFSCVPELFHHLRKEGWTLVLASSGKKDDVARYEKLLEIENLTDIDVSADDVKRSKPHPDIFQVALKKLHGINPDRVLAIGDTPYDIQAAQQLKIRTIAVLGGGFPEAKLRATGAVAVFRGPAELLFRYEDWAGLV